MAEIVVGMVASLAGPAIELGKCVVAPIKCQFNYLCCFNSNIQSLRNEKEKLELAGDRLRMQVARAESNLEVISREVENWLEDVDEILVSAGEIESEIAKIQDGCLAVKSRFSLSKKARQTAQHIKEVQDCPNFILISHPPTPGSMVPIPLETTYEFQSRKHIEDDIMATLRSETVSMIGICGMGGVGKTTMAKRVMNRAREEHLFDEIAMVVVSQQENKLRIQDEIAEKLGLKLEEGSLSFRAQKLYNRLVGGERILIVIDDVWDYLRLEELGIPCESGLKECKLLLTSRDHNIFKAMDVQKVCEVNILSQTEARHLFRSTVGTFIDDNHKIFHIAQEVVWECNGLPIALIAIGMALKDQQNISIWKDVLQQLKNSAPIDIPEVLDYVYKPLRLSYELLKSENAKSLFLLCCLFAEDDNIPISHLTFYAMGLGILERIRNLEEARNRVCLLVDMLKSHFLLLDGNHECDSDSDDNEYGSGLCDNHYVRMHDVVRDVAIFVASKERHIINCSYCTWISSYHSRENLELAMGLNPCLRLLLIDNSVNEKFEISDNFFQGMIELNVLSISNNSLRSLPHTTQLLKNLRSLILDSCESLETISIVGELLNLEILVCRYCFSIEELPVEIGRLNRLRLLELSDCPELQTIVPGTISSLIGLEELKMSSSFHKWEAENKEGKGGKNAGLSELESLSNLTCLQIEVEDFTLAAKQIHLPPKIEKFDIAIGEEVLEFDCLASENHMKLHLPRQITLGNWIHKYIRGADHVYLIGDGSNNLDLGRAHQNLRSLTLKSCSTMKKLVDITTTSIDGKYGTATVFPLLEYLEIDKLVNLEEICGIGGTIPDEGSSNYFKNLKGVRLKYLPALKHLWTNPYQDIVSLCNLSTIEIVECHSIRNLFSWAIAKDCLLQLKRFEIKYCKMMEHVFMWNEEDKTKDIGQTRLCAHHIKFPKLKRLGLFHLPNLNTFCKGVESIEFPLLTETAIFYCPKLKSLVSTTSTGHGNNHNNSRVVNNNHDDDFLHLFCKLKVSFGGLRELRMRGCHDTSTLWCHQISINFFTELERLQIRNFGNIRSLFSSSIAGSLVNLKLLEIGFCKEMLEVIDNEEDKDARQTTIRLFPKLRFLILLPLSKLEIFCKWRCALELPSLEVVDIYNCPKMGRFSLGSLTTPNLTIIKIDNNVIANPTKDLNGVMEQRFLSVKQEEKEDEREEEERRK